MRQAEIYLCTVSLRRHLVECHHRRPAAAQGALNAVAVELAGAANRLDPVPRR